MTAKLEDFQGWAWEVPKGLKNDDRNPMVPHVMGLVIDVLLGKQRAKCPCCRSWLGMNNKPSLALALEPTNGADGKFKTMLVCAECAPDDCEIHDVVRTALESTVAEKVTALSPTVVGNA